MPLSEQQAQTLYIQALAAHNAGNHEQAEQQYREILRSFPKLDPVLANLGSILVGKQQLREAIKNLEKALKINPHNIDAMINLGAAFKAQGKPKKAVQLYLKVQEMAPNRPEIHFNLANMHYDSGDMEKAESAYREAIRISPGFSSAWFNLGNLLYDRGEAEEAERYFRKAMEIDPKLVGAMLNLGHVLMDTGKANEGLAIYDLLIEKEPESPLGHWHKGKALIDLDRPEGALEHLQKAIKIAPDQPDIRVLKAIALVALNRKNQAIWVYEKILESYPDHEAANRNYRRLLSRMIPGWHFVMLADEERNNAFEKALNKAVKPDMLVLDIGAGSGLLSMMAARAGAGKVVACEMVEPLAKVATEIIQDNGYQDQITVLDKKSSELVLGKDLPRKADLLVSEILDAGLLGEGVIPSVRDAKAQLLTPNAQLIPAKAAVYGVLVNMPERRKITPIRKVSGFDLSRFDRFRASDEASGLFLNFEEHTKLSEPFLISSIDFYHLPPPAPDEKPIRYEVEVPATQHGTLQAIVYWFDLYLDQEIMVSSRPGGELKHWGQGCFFFDQDLKVKPGKKVRIKVIQTDVGFGFEL